MYTQLSAQTICTRQHETRECTIRPDAAATPSSRRIRRRAAKAIAALGVCVAVTTGVAITDASATPRSPRSNHVSAAQLEREIAALRSVGFVPAQCEARGTLMTNYHTGQSVLLSW
ncbi:MAG TPA: hypothetical protein VMF57_21745 [Solirubrobacteraceae bacterium]|nr:hypothetical protein [Solirubrobacteraceae bacterium]